MAIIGTFTQKDGKLQGKIHTLTIEAGVTFIPTENRAEGAPEYRVFSGKAELGAAWAKSSDKGTYHSVKLDDPSFLAPIYASLFQAEDGSYNLVWQRRKD